MTAFTPGTWHVNVARLSDGSINVAHVVAPDRASVAQLSVYGEEETVANAHMIAAAPDLYTACSNWIAWMDSDGVLVADAFDHENRMLDAMRAALAKAERPQA